MQKYFPQKLLSGLILFCLNGVIIADSLVSSYQETCLTDLGFLQKKLKDNSANYANQADLNFQNWYQQGYQQSKDLLKLIEDADDCYYVMKYYLNGFDNANIALRGYSQLPAKQYPGFLIALEQDKYHIIYLDEELTYLSGLKIGDEITYINDIAIDKYHQEYLLPFYAADRSSLSQRSASMQALIIDGNKFKPVARNIIVKNQSGNSKLDLKYLPLTEKTWQLAQPITKHIASEKFKVEMVSAGVWIRIPSFFPTRQEAIYFKGMLANLKNELAKEDYILFDLRGNRGGSHAWSRPIIRNLWGDQIIKKLGKEHIYNQEWQTKIRISKENFANLPGEVRKKLAKSYQIASKKGENFITNNESIYQEQENIYTSQDPSKFKANIYVLTDNFCQHNCWDFVREIRQMPGVVHIGQATSIQSIYTKIRQIRSPSEEFDFFLPTEIKVKPSLFLGESLKPAIEYKGDMQNEAELIDWILSITEKTI